MTVAQLIEFLQKQPQDLQVVFKIYSEFCLLEEDEIEIGKACFPRADLWVHHERPDQPSQEYLIFPGN